MCSARCLACALVMRPSSRGRLLSVDDVKLMIGAAGWGFQRMALPVADPIQIFTRMLRNLINLFQQQHDTQKLMLCMSQMLLLMHQSGDRNSMQHCEQDMQEYRFIGTARILNP